ncbi:MAG: hypothetical protein GY798_03035 [Hyphomicrobiales bacterium]|nr:hypothetical protein [Hyphomicrobiales bacterium]
MKLTEAIHHPEQAWSSETVPLGKSCSLWNVQAPGTGLPDRSGTGRQ